MTRWQPMTALAALIATLAILPVAVLVELADFSIDVFADHNLQLVFNSIALCVTSVVGAVVVGVPLAVATAFLHFPGSRLWLVLLIAPLALPSYLGAFAFYAAFGVGGEWGTLTGLALPRPEGLLGASIIMTLYTYPFVLMTTRAALLQQDDNALAAARTLGLGFWASLWSVALPRVVKGTAAGCLLVSLYALSDFGTPAIMGLDTFTRLIYVEYNAFGLPQAALLSLQLLALVALVLFLESRVPKQQERPGRSMELEATPANVGIALTLSVPPLLLALALPIGIFSLWLFREGAADFDFSMALNSMQASVIAAVAAAVAAVPVAIAALGGRVGRFFERLTYLGFGVPGIVMGTALVYLGLKLPLLYQTLSLLVAAYVLRFLPLAVGAVRASLEAMDTSLVSAARVLGASPGEAFRRVTLPLGRRGVIAGAALVFLEAMRELPATLLLAPSGFETLATYLWRVYEAGYFGDAAVPGLILILLSALGLLMMLLGERGRSLGVSRDAGK